MTLNEFLNLKLLQTVYYKSIPLKVTSLKYYCSTKYELILDDEFIFNHMNLHELFLTNVGENVR